MNRKRLPVLLALLTVSASAIAAPAPIGRDSRPIEPVEIPPSVQQGVDMIFVDSEIAPAVHKREGLLKEIGLEAEAGSASDLFLPANPVYTQLRRGLVRYRASWGSLPQIQIPAGPVLKPGAKGERVALLRERLGVAAGSAYDDALARAVKRYQQVHAIKADGIAGEGTIASLNRGAAYYERVLMLNLDRARSLPGTDEQGRYVIVDVGAARLFMVEGGDVRDSMKVIVGKAASATPMMAAQIRYASVNPYWNVPADLAQTLVAPKVLSEGLGHIKAERYEILSDWTDDATPVDPASVDWQAVADRKTELRIRQLPGRGNSMGAIKFMLPNDFGIYLHDTNDKSLFGKQDRWLSNGCVRVEDARRLADWLFGAMPTGKDPNVEEDVELDRPVPVYITYLTAEAVADGVQFRADPYSRDAALVNRYATAEERSAASGG
ncbi:L,D-transpeptidase family protein [Sphingosinicella sp. BN140058]|uniref:L,D-transpeptidase family protein n=1 Tax=Sphingosinicella sp. BN140058 TaxID=1892855 RepID=UPI0010115D32|nr:L,D-transpeptidase family protein [Sphingosinicella sp. BN140058]QAY79229.1 murein L,D-transpeptidase [Sphingosinicella sp. BN140058]